MKKKETKYPLPIREWSEDDRPREKLLKYGEHTLSNAELLAIMIRTGAPGKSAVDIGRELLHKFKSLRAMSGVDTSEFKKITGLKNAKIAQIKAAIELGRRMLSEEKALEGPVKSSTDVVGFLMPLIGNLKKERFLLLLLDKRNTVSDVMDIDYGTVDQTNPYIRDIIQMAKDITHALVSVDRKLLWHESKKSTLQALFKAMLNKLMTGEIRVKDFDIDTSCILEMKNKG